MTIKKDDNSYYIVSGGNFPTYPSMEKAIEAAKEQVNQGSDYGVIYLAVAVVERSHDINISKLIHRRIKEE